MAPSSFLDRCRFNPTAGGTTDWTVSSAAPGCQTPAAAGAVNGAVYSYVAESADLTQWEIGVGTYNSGTLVLTRTAVLYNSGQTGTGAGQTGAGTKISFTVAPQVAITALNEDLFLFNQAMALSAAQKLQAQTNIDIYGAALTYVSPGTPTGTSSATGVMMGYGASCAITPVYSTRVQALFDFQFTAASVIGGTAQIRFGTGTAPANAAALAGTAVGSSRTCIVAVASSRTPAPLAGFVNGLTRGTAYWFDLSLSTGSGSVISVESLNCTLREV